MTDNLPLTRLPDRLSPFNQIISVQLFLFQTVLAAIKYEYLDINKILEMVLKFGGEGPFFEKSVRDLVWGYKDKMLEVGNELAPQWFYTDFVGYFMNVSITFDSKRSYNESVSGALNFTFFTDAYNYIRI